jgi:hypothetical protein
MQKGYKVMRDVLYNNPSLLPFLPEKQKNIIENVFVPYDWAIEIETSYKHSSGYYNLKESFKDIDGVMDIRVGDDETAIRFEKGIKGLLALEKVVVILKNNYYFNTGSGIHYNVNLKQYKNRYDLNKIIKSNVLSEIYQSLKSWKYEGTYNKFGIVGINDRQGKYDAVNKELDDCYSFAQIAFRDGSLVDMKFVNNTVKIGKAFHLPPRFEVRIGEMSFDYSLIVKRVLSSQAYVRKIHKVS